MISIGARRTETLLPLGPLSDEVESVLRLVGQNRIVWEERNSLSVGDDATFFSMLASDAQLAINKTVCAHPANRARGLPTVNGLVAVFSTVSGEPLMLLDGPVLTARRTAAVSMLALRKLQPGASSALLVGAGVLARTHMEGMAQAGVKRVLVHARTAANAQRLAQYGRTLGMQCEVVDDIAGAMPPVEVIFTLTSSPTPVLFRVAAATRLVVAMGSYKPTMAELSCELVDGASGVYVDTMAGARQEAGELVAAKLDWGSVRELSDMVDSLPEPLVSGYRIFKSVGHSLWDLAAARLAHRLFAGDGLNEETVTCLD